MQAKDTVMDELVIASLLTTGQFSDSTAYDPNADNRLYHSPYEKIATHQAEITWPIAEKVGMRKVVEWIVYCPECGSYLPKNLNNTRTLKCMNCNWNGQAKLKEWGL